jgi:capsular exopolysaccharide synthesis family protein
MDMESPKNQPPPEARLHFLDYWRIIRIRKAIIITVFLITAIIATAVTFILPVSYASTSEIEIKPDGPDITDMTGQVVPATYDPYFLQTELTLLEGPTVLGKVVEQLDLNNKWGAKYGVGAFKTSETVEFLKNMIGLSPVRNTTLVDITVYSGDKNEAATLANAIAKAYHDYRLEQHTVTTAGGIKVLEEKYQAEEQQIQEMQTKVETLRKQFNIVDVNPTDFAPTPTYDQETLRQYKQMELEGETRYNRLDEQLTQLKALSPDTLKDVLPTENPDSMLSDLLGKLNVAKESYTTLTNDYSPANPNVIKAQDMITELNHEIDARVTGIMEALKNNKNTEKVAVDTLTQKVQDAIEKDRDEFVRGQPYWLAKSQKADMAMLHKALYEKIEMLKISEAIPKTTVVRITKNAEPGKDPVRPNKPLNITLGLIFGLVVGIGLAFFIEYLDTSVKTIDDVERAFQAPVLGVIPQNVGYLIDEGPESRYAEAYRVLRTNILFARKDEKLTTIVVVSAGAGEGKSTTTLNLATVFAQAGQRVLVVDSDLRRPTLHKLLHVTNDTGLTNYLLKQNALEEVIQTTNVPTLNFMASGKLPSSSMSILNSAQMKEVIADLKQRYDFIFFDSPPILGVSDASVLASEMDMVVQIIQYRRYPQPMNLRAKQVIEKVGGTFLGIVLNNINMSQDESYYYYSGYYHDYYYSSSPKDQEKTAVPKKPGGSGPTPDDSGPVGIKQKY